MKKILNLFILFLSLISIRIIVNAETFRATDLIEDIYISRVHNGKDDPFYGQYIEDSKGNIVYCLEPYVNLVDDDPSYSEVGDVNNYTRLNKAQIRRISLLAYYGYGYNNRTSSDWYIVTQFLIWQTVEPDSDIYFTDTKGGNRITKFTTEISALEKDVENHDKKPSFVKDYTVNLNESLDINALNSNDYEIVSNSYDNDLSNGFHLSKVTKSGSIVFKKKSNHYQNKIAIYDSLANQDLLKPGNIDNDSYTININVTKGDITLDIQKDTSVYTVESDFSNTCYEIRTKSGDLVEKVCAQDEMIYKTLDLPYGDYVVKQVSFGIGYKEDTKTYDVTINKKNEHPKVTLENLLIRNTIEIIKYACRSNVCAYERGAAFAIIDKLGNNVDTIETSNLGYASITIGYGTYTVEQVATNEDYTLAESYQEKIVDETSEHKRTLYNYYKEPEPEPEPEPTPEPEPEPEPEPTPEPEPEPTVDEINPPITGIVCYDPLIAGFALTLILKKIKR